MDSLNQIVASIGRFVCHWDALDAFMGVCYTPTTVGYAVLVVLILLSLIISTLLRSPVPRDLKIHPHVEPYQRGGADRRVANHPVAVDRRVADRRYWR
jgi:hypothetical protein